MRHMSQRDRPLSDYIRMRIRGWQDGGRELKELARLAGIGKSSPSQVLLGTGVAGKTAPGYARAFGFKSLEDLDKAAYEWWLSKGKAAADLVEQPDEPAIKEAIEVLIKTFGATEAQLRAILVDFSAERFRGRDAMFWINTLGTEVKRDKDRLAADARDRAETQQAQAQVRKSHRARKEKAGDPPPPASPPASERPHPQKRHAS